MALRSKIFKRSQALIRVLYLNAVQLDGVGYPMKSPFRLSLVFAFLCASILISPASRADDLRFFKIASGSPGGTYFPIASLIAKVISNPPGSKSCDEGGNCGIPDLTATAQSSKGSVANVDGLLMKAYPAAIAQSDVAYWAYTATGPFRTRKPNKQLCVISSLYPEDVHLVATRSANISGVDALAGKRVALGERESGALLGAQLLVRAYGLQEGKDFAATLVNYSDAQSLIKDRKLDAFVAITGYPNEAIEFMIQRQDMHLVPIVGDGQERLIKGSPFYSASMIPRNVYSNQPDDIQTVAVNALWIARTNLDPEFVYQLTRTFWSNKHARSILDNGHPKGGEITLQTAFNGVPIPLCSGAQKYYQEIGMLK